MPYIKPVPDESEMTYSQKNYYLMGGKDKRRKSDWVAQGLIDDPDEVLKMYKEATHCLICDKEFVDSSIASKDTKVMNHDHESGHFLNIICWICNIKEHTDGYWVQVKSPKSFSQED